MAVESSPPRFSVPAVIGPGYQTLTADLATPVQSDFLGIGAVNMAFLEFPEYGLSAAQKTAEYDRARTSGLRLARTAVKTDWAMATYPAGAADWSSTKMGYLYAYLQAMKDRGVSVVLTAGWHFPGAVCDIDLNGVVPACTPSGANETAWKQWASNLLHQTINVRGFDNIVAVFFFTEPNNNGMADPAATGPQIPGGIAAGTYYANLVTAARAQIAADDAGRTPILPRIKLIGCEEHNLSNDIWLEYVKAAADPQFDAYAAHSYEDTPTFGPLGLSAVNSPSFATYLALWQNWRGDANPKNIWSDEYNQLVNAGGDADTTGYRRTADAGMRIGRGLVAHMKAGVQAPFIWTFRDEHFEGSGGYTQLFGIKQWADVGTVKPSWYCVSMLANLCGGGSGTTVYDGGDVGDLHGAVVYVPPGDRWSTSAAGDWTFVVVNDGPLAQWANVRFPTVMNRTFYRYTYSGEHVPISASDPAYVLPWDQRYDGVTTTIPANLIPGRSVVCYSTMVPAAGVENLALSATVTADSTGYGQASNVARGNRSNVLSVFNSWCKADNASHYVELAWSGAVGIGRIELAFVGTTAGVVWADYATAGAPAPLADYTIHYRDSGGAWQTLVTVTGNALPNRSHTVSVSTSAIRLYVTSAAATAHVNNVGVFGS